MDPAPERPAGVPAEATWIADAYRWELAQTDASGRKQAVRVPLVDADTLDKQFGVRFQTGVPDEIRNQLKDNGYAVKSKRQYAPLWLENGRPLILPVEDTNIVPASNKVF